MCGVIYFIMGGTYVWCYLLHHGRYICVVLFTSSWEVHMCGAIYFGTVIQQMEYCMDRRMGCPLAMVVIIMHDNCI